MAMVHMVDGFYCGEAFLSINGYEFWDRDRICPKNGCFMMSPVPIESPVTNVGVQHSWKSSINAYLAIARRDYQKVDHFEPHPRIKIISGFSMLLKFGESEKAQAHAPRSIFGNMATQAISY